MTPPAVGHLKSTLIANLKEVLQKRSNVHSYRFSTTDRGFQLLWNESQQWQPKDVVIVDGYEQLATWLRWRLHYRTYLRRACLLISAHNDYPTFPILWRTAVDEEQAKRLRNELLETRPDLIEAADLEVAWSVARQTHPTDMRETFMTMYDWVEMQKQKRPASHNNSRAV